MPLLMNGRIVPWTEDVQPASRQRHKKRHRRPFDRERIRSYLEATLVSEERPRPCMREVASRIGYRTAHIAHHFPRLCAAISALYLAERHAKCREGMEVLKSKVREAALEVHARGLKPTTSRVGALLVRPGLLRSPELLTVLRDVRRELEQAHSPES